LKPLSAHKQPAKSSRGGWSRRPPVQKTPAKSWG
jgi:hypothetical protein